jgi:metallo-beta-lactamase family protein
VLIPAFAVGRSQLILYLLHELTASRRIPAVPIHLDSPMAVEVTRLYSRHSGSPELDPDWGREVRLENFVENHSTVEQSLRLNSLPGPRVIVSSSGMLTGGRVLHHLARLSGDPRNLILLAGYQAAGTRGRALVGGARLVRVHGRDVEIRARVVSLDGFSAHADVEELLSWTADSGRKPDTVFLVHGEPEAIDALSGQLERRGYNVTVPRHGETFELTAAGRWRAAH